MVCYFKAELSEVEISNLPYSEVSNYSSLDNATGSIGRSKSFSFYNIRVVKKSDRYAYIEGSLHYFKNSGIHNCDDFTIDELWSCCDRISCYFNIDIEKLPLVRLEIGLNIDPLSFYNSASNPLCLHRGVPFKSMYIKNGDHRVCHHADYDLKVYNKKVQFPHFSLDEKIMRVEAHASRARLLHKHKCYRLENLRNAGVRNSLLHWLIIDLWPKILFIDPGLANPNIGIGLSKREISKLRDWYNPNYWYQLNPTQFKYQRMKYEEFLCSEELYLQQDLQSNLISKAWKLYQFPR